MRRALLLTVIAAGVAAGQQTVQFKEHVIEADIPGGYAVLVADINHDGKPDVIGVSQRKPDLTWYENPTWEPHVIVSDIDVTFGDFAFIRKVRALPPPLASTPALALTTTSRSEEVQAAIAAGYQRQLHKPPEPTELTEAVARLGAPGAP